MDGSISRSEILMGRDREYPLTSELEQNLAELLSRLNKFRQLYQQAMLVTSGYRPGRYNTDAHGAPNSAHLTCEACDFADGSRVLTNWILNNPSVLVQCDLYMEHPDSTPTWVHLQSRVIPSGSRIFRPFAH